MSNACQRCNLERIVEVQSHASDMHFVRINGKEKDGYLPGDLGVGGGDDLHMTFCLDCGQIQGTFPLPPCELEIDYTCLDCGTEGKHHCEGVPGGFSDDEKDDDNVS